MKVSLSHIVRIILCLLVVLAFIAGITNFYKIEKTEMASVEGRTFETAKIVEITKDNLQENGTRSGEQQVVVKMLSGKFKGQQLEATSSDGNLFGAVCKVGMKVVVIVSATDSGQLVSVYSADRRIPIFVYIVIFALCICLIGGKNGIKSVLGLAATFVALIYIYVPLVYKGFSPFWMAIFVSALTTVITMYLVGGYTRKTLSAIIGTVFGVLIAGVCAHLFGKAAGISGYNVSDIETLLYVGQNTPVQIGELLFAGILIASLGAVMDVAMSISSTIEEIANKKPDLNAKQLFLSGLHVGRDMMGTMSNTLILAFVGGSLSVLIVDYAYNLPFLQLINSYTIGIEIMQGISGSMGVILTVPFVSLSASILLTKVKTDNS